MSSESAVSLNHTHWPFAGALALLPWVFILIDDSWLYSPPGTLDPWVYHGFMRNYPAYISAVFPDSYYGTRLGWIVPGYVSYALFPPGLANLLLHLAFYYAAVFAAYAILAPRSAHTAFIGAVMIGASPPIRFAIGWDYVDGAVITYALVAIAAAIRATATPGARPGVRPGARPGVRPWAGLGQACRPAWAVASGAALACMVHSNAVSVLFTPLVPLVFLTSRAGGMIDRVRLIGVAVGGAVLATAALAAVNVVAGGSWAFFMPTIEWVLQERGSVASRNYFRFPEGLKLVIPAIAFVAAIASLMRRRRGDDARTPVPLLLIWAVCAMGAFDLLGGALFAYQFYVSWVVPLALLALATLCARDTAHLSRGRFWCAVVVLIAAGAFGLHGGIEGRWGFDQQHRSLLVTTWTLLGGTLLVTTIALATSRAGAVVLSVWILLFGAATALAGRSMVDRPEQEGKDLFGAVDQVLRLVRTNEYAKRPLFWYGASMNLEFRSIAATYLYQYSLLGEDYPALPGDATAEERYGTRVRVGTRIAVLDRSPVDEASLRSDFGRHGLGVQVTSAHRITAGRRDFLLTLLDVVPLPTPSGR